MLKKERDVVSSKVLFILSFSLLFFLLLSQHTKRASNIVSYMNFFFPPSLVSYPSLANRLPQWTNITGVGNFVQRKSG